MAIRITKSNGQPKRNVVRLIEYRGKLVAATVSALMCGCMATPTAAGKRVRDSTDFHVSKCQFVSELFEKAQNLGSVEEAKIRARNSAAKLGATDIVWKDVVYRSKNTEVIGKAYRCS